MAMSNKKSFENTNGTHRNQIDNIASYSQKPRSKTLPSKPRIDLSVFQCHPSSNLSNSGSLSESIQDEVGLSLSPWTDLKEMQSQETECLESALVSCSNFQNNGRDFFNSVEVNVTGFETVMPYVTSHHSPERKAGKGHFDAVKMLDSCPVQSRGSRDIDMTLAELAREKMTVQMRQMRCSAQELEKKGHPTSCRESDPQQDSTSDKRTSCTSSEADNFVERGRGKRERKRKVHFDDMTNSVKSERKVRRFKIMRYLGLAAPIGSPF